MKGPFQTAFEFGRRAKFKISWTRLMSHPDKVQTLLSKVLVVKAEMSLTCNSIEYEAISPMFDEVPEGEISPLVQLEIRPTGLGTDRDSWEFEFYGE